MVEHKYSSVKKLAEDLHISRTTLYRRAKYNQVELNGVYTDEQLNALKSIKINELSEQSEHQSEHFSEQSEHFSEQSEHQSEHFSEQINKEKILISQLDVKDEQIKVLINRLEQAQKSLDQAQQLQLIAEQRLTDEHKKVIELSDQPKEKKSFWKRFFS